MNVRRKFLPIAVVAALSVVALNGCKSSSKPASTASAQSPAAAQPAQNMQQAAAPQQAAPAYSTPQQAAPMQAAAPQAPPQPPVVVLPAGTYIRIRTSQDLGSNINHTGDMFSATVANPVTVNGQTVIPQGASAEGTVIYAKPLGRLGGNAELAVRLERIRTQWGSYPVATSSISQVQRGKGRRTAIMAGGGAGLGALIGGLAGGGKGALIGALAGGGAGTAGSAFTGNKPIFVPAETLLTFRLDHSVRITE